MKKYTFFLCILISFHFSIQITDEELYDYAVILFRGMANLENREEAQCANLLRDRKDDVLPIVKDIIKLINDGEDYYVIYLKVIQLYFLDNDCDIYGILQSIYNLINDKGLLNSTIHEFGQKISGKIDYSVD